MSHLQSGLVLGDPDAIVLATQSWNPSGGGGLYNDSNIGVWYDGASWILYNEDIASMPDGASFNIQVASPDSAAFVHTVTSENTSGATTTLGKPRRDSIALGAGCAVVLAPQDSARKQLMPACSPAGAVHSGSARPLLLMIAGPIPIHIAERGVDRTIPHMIHLQALACARRPPSQSAAARWRSGQAEAVKRKTEGALTITDLPWGTIGASWG